MQHMLTELRLSILDQSTVVTGRTPASSIRESLELARHCEALGYYRYWVAEHHNSASQAGTAPEVLMAAIASTTNTMRVGSAGVMLPHYSSLKVAEVFRVLEAVAPGRIDMGLGRAPGSDGRTAYALNPLADSAADHFPSQVRDLLHWVRGEELVEGHPFRGVIAQPAGPTAPQPWILGSSDYGAQVAAYFGLPFCFAAFITDGSGVAEALEVYRSTFRPSLDWPAPHVGICIWAMAADTAAEAERQFLSRAVWRLGRDRGVYAPLPSPEEAAATALSDPERERMARTRSRAIIGTGTDVAARLQALARQHGASEIAILTTMHDPAARRRSYALIAEAAGLQRPEVARAAE
jgi:luciferase family oxidoreductase group 1